MPRSIIMFATSDFTLRKNGSHVRMAELASFLESNFAGATIYGFRDHPDDPWDAAAEARFARAHPRLKLVLDQKSGLSARITKVKTALLYALPGKVARILAMREKGRTPNWDRLLGADKPPLVIVNWVDGAVWLNGVPSEHLWIESHDVKFLKYAKKVGAQIYSQKVSRKMASEAAILSVASGIVAISPVDRVLLEALAPNNNVYFVPTYTTFAAPAAAAQATQHQYDLLFVGALNPFNADGLREFAERNHDWLQHKRLAVAGKVTQDEALHAALAKLPKADILGFVDDLGDLYATSKVVLSPVDGTGLKIKVLEALGHGKPVAASTHTRDGLPPGHQDCVFNLAPATIDQLLDDPAAYRLAAAAAREYYAQLSEAGDRQALLEALTADVKS